MSLVEFGGAKELRVKELKEETISGTCFCPYVSYIVLLQALFFLVLRALRPLCLID